MTKKFFRQFNFCRCSVSGSLSKLSVGWTPQATAPRVKQWASFNKRACEVEKSGQAMAGPADTAPTPLQLHDTK